MGLIKREVRKRVVRPARKKARQAARQATHRWCPECRKSMPPFHTCVIKTDFKRRRKQADRRAKSGQRRKTSRPPHPYQDCHDGDCKRPACVAFREGFESGVMNCPGPHA